MSSTFRRNRRRLALKNLLKEKGWFDKFNDHLATIGDLTLHPTKGYRRMSLSRSLAAILTADIKAGRRRFIVPDTGRQLRSA